VPDRTSDRTPGARCLALLGGVDCYPHFGPAAQLRSCANDARLMADVLAGAYGFCREDMTLLLDHEATREALLGGLGALRARARPGDVVVFYWSGHGSYYGGYGEGRHETIVPTDSGRAPQENRDVTDQEIYDQLLAMSEVTPYVSVIVDTCFSGGIVRDDWTEKWVEPSAVPPVGLASAALRDASPLRDLGPAGFLPVGERYVLLAACRSRETAKVLKSRPYSAFTWFLAQELLRAPAGATYLDAMERVRLALSAEVPDQMPQVEGARGRVLFGAAARPAGRFLPVVARDGSRLVLGGGIVHGVGAGSVWDLHPAGAREPQGGARLGRVRVESVEAVRATAAIVEERGPLAAGLRAFEHAKGPGWLRLAVGLDEASLGAAERRRLATAVRRSPLLTLASPGAAAVRVVGLAPAAGGERRAICVAEPSWAILGAEDALLRSPLPREGHGAAAGLVESLEGLARARNLLAIDGGLNPAEEGLAGRIEVELLRSRGGEPFRPALPDEGGDVVFQEGDRIGLRIVQRSSRPLYLHVLDVGPSGSIGSLFPVTGAHEPHYPGAVLEIGLRPEERLVVRVPEDLARRAAVLGSPCVQGREVVKVFATAGEADLTSWAQPGWRDEQTARGGLAALMARAVGGAELREDPPAGDPDAAWTVVTQDFLVRRESCAGSVDGTAEHAG
jgi:hypothetical protein